MLIPAADLVRLQMFAREEKDMGKRTTLGGVKYQLARGLV